MNYDLKAAEDRLATERLNLAARNLQHLMKMQDEQVTLENIVAALRTSVTGALNGDRDDFSFILANQSNILDAAFLHYVERAKGSQWHADHINMALKAQRQTERTINTWHRINENKKIPGTK
ncbi:MAG: hypothetical protein DI551_08615 [Micavibrio aeruginosavorus]|uniref:Uncharacterized protein n=1 Tax=Micavibrio aeruginosavorus TaxID=349221 RepID=A0A2W5MXZ7_9BACT|nr:MAG: hypothetical protein DI551_08615 [Micavibrio aeruginosavorus]